MSKIGFFNKTENARHWGGGLTLKRSDFHERYHEGFGGKKSIRCGNTGQWSGTEQEAIQFALRIPECVGFTRNEDTSAVYFSTNVKTHTRKDGDRWCHETDGEAPRVTDCIQHPRGGPGRWVATWSLFELE